MGCFMVCSKARLIIWMRSLMLVAAGFGGLIIVPSLSSAQYPGSAGELNVGAFSGASSASNGSTSSSASTSGDGASTQSASDSSIGYGPSVGADAEDGQDHAETPTAIALQARKATRKRALIRQFRLEFAQTLIIETASKRPLKAVFADQYLNQFSQELDVGLDRQADLNSLGQDLAVVRDAIDGRLDVVIATFSSGNTNRRRLFMKARPTANSVPALRAEISELALKHELLEFSENSLQAMGYFVK